MASAKGGDGMKRALRDIEKRVKSGKFVRVGFLEDAKYPDGTSVAMAAAINNYGAPKAGIPPRPFFSNMIATKKDDWPRKFATILKSTGFNAYHALQLMGEGIKGQLQQAIIDTNEPPLSPITIMLRGMKSHDQNLVITGKTVGQAAQRVKDGKTNYGASTKVLDDSGHMLNSVGTEVKK